MPAPAKIIIFFASLMCDGTVAMQIGTMPTATYPTPDLTVPTTTFDGNNRFDLPPRQFEDALSVYVELTWTQGTGHWNRVFDFHSGHQTGYDLQLCGYRNKYVAAYFSNTWYGTSNRHSQGIVLNTPTKVFVSFTASSVKLCVNGVEEVMAAPGPDMINHFRTSNALGHRWYDTGFQGTMENFRLWDSEITCQQAMGSPAAASGSPAAASARGDPHMQNVHGQRFDLAQPGAHVLVNLPRFATPSTELLRLEAQAERLGGNCADLYFTRLNVTGSLVRKNLRRAPVRGMHKVPKGMMQFNAEKGVVKSVYSFGKVTLKVVRGATQEGARYLNIIVHGLGLLHEKIGGLLGDDDFTFASTPSAKCRKQLVLAQLASRVSSGKTNNTGEPNVRAYLQAGENDHEGEEQDLEMLD